MQNVAPRIAIGVWGRNTGAESSGFLFTAKATHTLRTPSLMDADEEMRGGLRGGALGTGAAVRPKHAEHSCLSASEVVATGRMAGMPNGGRSSGTPTAAKTLCVGKPKVVLSVLGKRGWCDRLAGRRWHKSWGCEKQETRGRVVSARTLTRAPSIVSWSTLARSLFSSLSTCGRTSGGFSHRGVVRTGQLLLLPCLPSSSPSTAC